MLSTGNSDRRQTKPLYRCWCKGTDKESSKPSASINWVLSRRARFLIFEDHVRCGDWVIAFADVEKATLYRTKSGLLRYQILQLDTKDRSFQFGFNPWADPAKYLKLELAEETVRLKQSPIGLVVRLAVLGFLAFEIWKRYLVN